jgi:lipopolysaccharide export system protein LptA
MPAAISRLRYWFAAAALLTVGVVTVFYLAARMHSGAVTELPKQIPTGVQRSTQTFMLSKSDGGHTLFTVRAEHATEYDSGSRAELKNVNIVVYGRQANRFDQIHGSDFVYDPRSGDVFAKGTVYIDLQGEGAGESHPDQEPPAELKNPIHLVTSSLAFSQKSGDANTNEKVFFQLTDASGWAVGAHYHAKRNELLLDHDVHIDIAAPNPASISGDRGYITKVPRTAVLYGAHVTRENSTLDAPQLTLFLRPDDTIERIAGTGGIESEVSGATTVRLHAPQGMFHLAGSNNQLQWGDLQGGVSFEGSGASTLSGSADTAHLQFGDNSQLEKIHAEGHARMLQAPQAVASQAVARALSPAGPTSGPEEQQVGPAQHGAPQPAAGGGRATGESQGAANVPSSRVSGLRPGSNLRFQTIELNADAVDMWLEGGNQLRRAETSGFAQITVTPQHSPETSASASRSQPRGLAPAATSSGSRTRPQIERTVITAAKFYGTFQNNRIASLLGVPDARVVSHTAGEPDQVSTSRSLEATFLPSGEISQVFLRDDVRYLEHLPNGTDRAGWAQTAVYRPATDTLVMQGEPRVVEGGMTTTALLVRIEHATGQAMAQGDVKTTYNDVKPQAGGALLASGDPIHVTAHTMNASRATGVARYSGDARLWQGANVVAAPIIDFDRDRRTIVAQSAGGQVPARAHDAAEGAERVATILTQMRAGQQSPIHVFSSRLTYADGRRLARFEGGVVAHGADGTLTANQADVYFIPASSASSAVSVLPSHSSQMERMVATGDVLLQQPNRQGTAQRLVYTAADDSYVLTGGRPTVFDAEHGTVTGDSLTFYNGDDRVLVEGGEHSRSITHTRAPK